MTNPPQHQPDSDSDLPAPVTTDPSNDPVSRRGVGRLFTSRARTVVLGVLTVAGSLTASSLSANIQGVLSFIHPPAGKGRNKNGQTSDGEALAQEQRDLSQVSIPEIVDTTSQLRSRPPGDRNLIHRRGYTAIGDGGADTFIWDPAAKSADNGGTVVKPKSVPEGSPGRWIQVGRTRIDTRSFGLNASNSDNAKAIQAAIAAAPIGGEVYIPPGNHTCATQILISKPLILKGVTNGFAPAEGVQNGCTLNFAGSNVTKAIWVDQRGYSVEVEGLNVLVGDGGRTAISFEGNRKDYWPFRIKLSNFRAAASGNKANNPLIRLVYAGVAILERCKTYKGGFYFATGVTSSSLQSCYAAEARTWGYEFEEAHYSSLLNCAADLCGASTGGGGYRISSLSDNLTFMSCGSEISPKHSLVEGKKCVFISPSVGANTGGVDGSGIVIKGNDNIIMNYGKTQTPSTLDNPDLKIYPTATGNQIIGARGLVIVDRGSQTRIDSTVRGQFTPELRFGNGTSGLTYAGRSGHWELVGNRLHIEMMISLSRKGTATGTAEIYGLPFAAKGFGVGSALFLKGSASLTSSLNALFQGTKIQVYQVNAALSDRHFLDDASLVISGEYSVTV